MACAAGSSTDCNFTCPNGGTWFVCTSAPFFVGCCSSDPCTGATSPACPDLYPASFNASIYDQILPNNCINDTPRNWYTCTGTDPPFIGCCKNNHNPCVLGECPSEYLAPAAWSQSLPAQLEVFLDGANIPTTTTTATSSSTSTSTSTGEPALSPTPVGNENNSSGISTGAIIGIVVGAVAVLLIVSAALFFRRRRRHHRLVPVSPAPEGQRILPADGEHKGYHGLSSPYQDSHMSSPDPTISVKYPSGSSTAFTMSSSSPPLSSHFQRPISEIYTQSDDYAYSNKGGLQISGVPTAAPAASATHTRTTREISELESYESQQPEIHELDGRGR